MRKKTMKLFFLTTFVQLLFISPASFGEVNTKSNSEKPHSISASKNAEMIFSNSDPQSTLFELYTSEGCSSCPPAEKYFNRMKADGRLFKQVFPLVFHVGYWDYIGWKDRLADQSFTQRQRAITRRQGKTTIYTPGVYRNSVIWERWRKSIAKPAELEKRTNGKLEVVLNKKLEANLKYDAAMTTTVASKTDLEFLWEFHWALLSTDVRTAIKKGERTGESATHHFSVLGYGTTSIKVKSSQSVDSSGSITGVGKTALRMQVEGFDPKAVVFWITEKKSDVPLQITGGFL